MKVVKIGVKIKKRKPPIINYFKKNSFIEKYKKSNRVI